MVQVTVMEKEWYKPARKVFLFKVGNMFVDFANKKIVSSGHIHSTQDGLIVHRYQYRSM